MVYDAVNTNVKLAGQLIINKEIIIYPTDTLYGFGVDATNSDAIYSLNRLKGRAQPLSIIIDSVPTIQQFVNLDTKFESDINKIFPGPYTALIPAIESTLSPLIQNGSPNIGIRIPDHFFPIQLTKLLGKPIVTTSINRHGNEPINEVIQVEIDFPNVDIYEDDQHKISIGSTIIDYSTDTPSIVRNGDGPYPL